MFVLNSAGTAIVNTDQIAKITIAQHDDAVLIRAGGNDSDSAITLGRYGDLSEAKTVLTDLYVSLYSGEKYYDMPSKRTVADDLRIHDARVKRKGGS